MSSSSGTQSVQSLVVSGEPWRASVLNSLRQNNRKTEGDEYKDFAAAVERTSWVKGGACRVNFGAGKWEACTLELEQTGTTRGGGTAAAGAGESEIDFGTLSIFGAKNKNKVRIYNAPILNHAFLESC